MIVAGFLIYRFVNKSGGSGKGYVVYALMKDAAGIAKHSQVRIAGIPVGSIHGVRLEGDRARIDWFKEAGPPPRTGLASEVGRLASILDRELRVEVRLS